MKIKNTLPFHDTFLRRMVSWVVKQIDLPVRTLKEARFGYVKQGCVYSGRFYSGSARISIRVDTPENYPYSGKKRGPAGDLPYTLQDQLDALVYLIGHEAWHAKQHKEKLRRTRDALEPYARKASIEVLAQFQAQKTELMEMWTHGLSDGMRKPKPQKPDASQKFLKELKRDEQHLKRWESKLKLAAGKVQFYRNRIKAIHRKIIFSASSSSGSSK